MVPTCSLRPSRSLPFSGLGPDLVPGPGPSCRWAQRQPPTLQRQFLRTRSSTPPYPSPGLNPPRSSPPRGTTAPHHVCSTGEAFLLKSQQVRPRLFSHRPLTARLPAGPTKPSRQARRWLSAPSMDATLTCREGLDSAPARPALPAARPPPQQAARPPEPGKIPLSCATKK